MQQRQIWLWLRRGVLAACIPLWAVLFYSNYWQAAIPAFGDPAVYQAALHGTFVKYCGAGVLLVAALAAEWLLRPAVRPRWRRQRQRELG